MMKWRVEQGDEGGTVVRDNVCFLFQGSDWGGSEQGNLTPENSAENKGNIYTS